MQRLTGDRGAVNVLVAVLVIPLIAVAAIAVDVGATWAERQQLRTGADAAALAVAQDCARGSCGYPAVTAQAMADANPVDDGPGTATVDDLAALTPASGRVTVTNTGVREHVFAPLLGIDDTTIRVSTTAAWGVPGGGTAMLPVAFSWCEFVAQTGGGLPSSTTERTIHLTKSSGTGCTGPSGNMVPGGFGWLTPDAGTCRATSARGGTYHSDPGVSPPSSCSPADFAVTQGRTILLPLYDQAGGTGSTAWYRIYGYAAFTVTGYHIVAGYSWNAEDGCTGSDRCFQGYFTRFVDTGDAFQLDPAAPNLGAAVVRLTT